MLDRETIDYFELQGARKVLEPYRYESIPDDPAEWKRKLGPTIRALSVLAEEGGRMLYEIAAQLRVAADRFAAAPGDPPQELTQIPAASPAEQTPDVLRAIAHHLEEWNSIPREVKYHQLPTTSWEMFYRFPRLRHLGTVYFGQDGLALEGDMEFADEDDGVRMYIDQVHPECLWHLPGLVAECHEGLALFHTEEQLTQFFELDFRLGCGATEWQEFLPMVARVCVEHMRDAHPPTWLKMRSR